MNLNPFVFTAKSYPHSKLATMVSIFCNAMQRVFFTFAALITLVVILEAVENWGMALCGAGILLALGILLKLYKDKWSNKVAAKQQEIDNYNTEE